MIPRSWDLWPAEQRLSMAATTYVARRERLVNPAGSFDKARRWWPADDEAESCCDHVRVPSRSWPYSLLLHCRTAGHVARHFGVDRGEMLRAARAGHSARVAYG